MAFVKRDRVREITTTTGIGAVTLGGAPGGYFPFNVSMSIGDTTWYAIVMPGTGWETGLGTYTGTNTLTRTTVYESSNSNTWVSFPTGSKDVFMCQPASQAQPAFPAGTLMLFQQNNAPPYWTKQTTHNDKALRVVSGTGGGSGGSTPFSSIFEAVSTVSNTTITQATMASHTHTMNGDIVAGGAGPTGIGNTTTAVNAILSNATTTSIGGDLSHNHTLTISVQYVDLIICAKD
jgi:hypothetical protein